MTVNDDPQDTQKKQGAARPHRWRRPLSTAILILVGLVIITRGAQVLLGRSSGTSGAGPQTDVTQAPPSAAVIAVADVTTLTAPSATPPPFPSPAPSATPTPTPTAIPWKLAVAREVYASYGPLLDSLPARYERLQVQVCANNTELEEALAGPGYTWAIHWAPLKPREALTLRSEPYVLAVHPSRMLLAGLDLPQLVDLATGREPAAPLTFVVGDGGQAARELLGLSPVGADAEQPAHWEMAADWIAAKEYIATHEQAIGLLPWDVVDARVQVLPVEGHSLDARQINAGDYREYPLVRRLRMSGGHAAPAPLVADLDAALHYRASQAVQLSAVGDVMLADSVGDTLRATSPRYPFEGAGVQEALAQADIAFGNLECALSDGGARVNKTYTFRADPAAVEGLQYAGFDVLSLANNHTGDYGDEALLDTLEVLREAQIATVGAGRTITEAHAAQIVEVDGLRVAFLAYNQILPDSFAATATSPGVAWMDPDRMVADVQAARQAADVVVVSCHWGAEYSAYPNASQRRLAQLLADAGASLILGHHPHVLQGLEYHADAFTAYSLGNFVFYPGLTAETVDTVILEAVLDSSGVKMVHLLPAKITRGQPALLPLGGDALGGGAPILQRILRVTQEQKALPR